MVRGAASDLIMIKRFPNLWGRHLGSLAKNFDFSEIKYLQKIVKAMIIYYAISVH